MHAPTSPYRAHPNGHAHPAAPPSGPDAKPQAPDGGRDAHGRFAEGNRGGPGNPFARQVAALRSALLARVTPQDGGDVAEALLRQAKGGSLAAAKLLLSYTLGKPGPAVDPDALDLHEWELYRRAPDPSPELLAATERVPLPAALTYLRAALPAVCDAQEDMLLDGIRAQEAQEQRQAAAREERRARREAKRAQKKPQAAPADAPPPATGNTEAAAATRGSAPAPAASSTPAPAPGDEHALELLAQLLEMTGLPAAPFGVAGGAGGGGAPSTNGDDGRPGRPRPPSANG
jgi:type II secretory pathway pseudopilin PulG